MIPFRVPFEPGVPLHEQVVYAATKAIIAGALAPGERFPSVRALSQELKINPNTAHKVIGELVARGLLEVHPGIGTVVAKRPPVRDGARLLSPEIERLVVEAKRLGLSLDDLLDGVAEHWDRTNRAEPAARRSR